MGARNDRTMDHVPAPVREALQDFRARLDAAFGDRVLDARLFGSHARGTPRADSDVDVLVVVRDLAPMEVYDVYHVGTAVFWDRLVRIAPLALSDAQWQELVDRERLIARDIESEGVALP